MNNEEKILALLEQMSGDISGLKTDVSGLKEDVSALKTDVAEMKERQITLEDNMGELMDDMKFVKGKAIEMEYAHGQMLRVLKDGQTVAESRLDEHDAQLRKLAR